MAEKLRVSSISSTGDHPRSRNFKDSKGNGIVFLKRKQKQYNACSFELSIGSNVGRLTSMAGRMATKKKHCKTSSGSPACLFPFVFSPCPNPPLLADRLYNITMKRFAAMS